MLAISTWMIHEHLKVCIFKRHLTCLQKQCFSLTPLFLSLVQFPRESPETKPSSFCFTLPLQSEVKYFQLWNSWNTSGIFLLDKENTTWDYSLLFIFALNILFQALTLLVWTSMCFVTLYNNILSLLILHKILLH